MILAALLAFILGASDSTMLATDSNETTISTPARLDRPILDGIGEDVFNPTPAWRSSFQNHSASGQTGSAAGTLGLMGFIAGVALAGPTAILLGGGGDACGLGCPGNGSKMLLGLAGGVGVMVLLPVLGYQIGKNVDAKARAAGDRADVRLDFAIDPILSGLQRLARQRAWSCWGT